MLNKVILMGRLTRDPETKYVNDKLVCQFSVAIDRPKQADGQKQTDFIPCVCWGKRAEFLQKWFTKGMMIIITGRLQSRSWEDKNGNRRHAVEVNVDEMSFGETKKARELSQQNAPVYPDASDSSFTQLDDDGSDVPF